MTRFSKFRRAHLFRALGALTLTVLMASGATAAAPRVDEGELLSVGFKVLAATNKAQEDWVRGLAPGQIRPMQRNGKKFFIYPDASRKQIYVGGPNEYAAYAQLHPETKASADDAAKKASAYRLKQDDTMKKATTRDLSDPFLGASWADFGW
jgi:hypothetical protein